MFTPKPIRPHFPDATAEKLLKIKGCDWDRPTLEARFNDLYDAEAFAAKYCP